MKDLMYIIKKSFLVLVMFILLCACKNNDGTNIFNNQNIHSNSEKQNILEDINAKYTKYEENDLVLELVDIKGEKVNCMVITRFSLNNQYIYQLWHYQDENNINLKLEDKFYIEMFLNNNIVYVKHKILDTILLTYDLENIEDEEVMIGDKIDIIISPNKHYLCIIDDNNVKIMNSEETLLDKNFYNSNDNENLNEYSNNNCIWSDDSKKLFIVCSSYDKSTVHILKISDFSFETYCYNDGNFIRDNYVLNANTGYILYNTYKIIFDNKLNPNSYMAVYLVNIYTGDTYEVFDLGIDGYNNENIFVDDNTIEGRDGDGNVTYKYKLDKKFFEDKFLYRAKFNHNKCTIFIKKKNENNIEFKFDYVNYLHKEKLSHEVLVKGIEENTGWNYDIKSIDISNDNKVVVCIGKNSTLFTKKFNKIVDEYYTEDHVILADMMLDSLVKTLKNDKINYSVEKLAILKIYFCTENNQPISIPSIRVKIPIEHSYKGLYALHYDEESLEDEETILARQKIEEAVTKETGMNVKSKEIFKIDNSYYAVVEIPDLIITYDSKYVSINQEYSWNRDQENSYELWKYSKGSCNRILYNSYEMKIEDYNNYNGGSFININSDYTHYLIKYKEEDNCKKLIYELKYSDYIESPNKEFICFINNNESIAIINRNDDKILDVFIDSNYEKKLWFPTVIYVSSHWWNNDSNRFYFTLGDAFIYMYQIDLQTLEFNEIGLISSSMDGCITNRDKEYVVYSTDVFRYDMDSHIDYINSKQGLELNFINLKTKEKYNIEKRLDGKFKVKSISDNLVEYNDPYNYNSRVSFDLSAMVDDKKVVIRENIILFIYENYNNDKYYTNKNLFLLDTYKLGSQYYQIIEIAKDDNTKSYELWRFLDNTYEKLIGDMSKIIPLYNKENLYLYYENSTENLLVKIKGDNIIDTVYEGKINSLISSPNDKYIYLSNTDGNIVILDENDSVLIEENIFTDLLVENKLSYLEIGVNVWSGNSNNLILMIKNIKNEKLAGIKLVDVSNKTVSSVGHNIDCLYNKIYLSMEKEFVLYITNREFSNEGLGNISNNMHLILENLYTGKKIEIFKTNNDYFNFYVENNIISYFTNDEQKYYTIKDDFFE